MIYKKMIDGFNYKIELGIQEFITVPKFNQTLMKRGFTFLDTGITDWNPDLTKYNEYDIMQAVKLGKALALIDTIGGNYGNTINGKLILCRERHLGLSDKENLTPYSPKRIKERWFSLE